MTDYQHVPTTSGVRAHYASAVTRAIAEATPADAYAEFDLWLDTVKAEVRRDALRDAAQALYADETAERGTTKAQMHAIYAAWLLDRSEGRS